MICPRCRRDSGGNTSAFCAGCGAPLALPDEPAPRPLEVTLPIDRRAPDRRAAPPAPAPRAAPGTPAEPEPFLAPPAGVNERSYWDLGRAVPLDSGPLRGPEPVPSVARAAGSRGGEGLGANRGETWSGGPVAAPASLDSARAERSRYARDERSEGELAPAGAADADLDDTDVDVAFEDEVRLRRAPGWKRALAWAIDLAPFALLAGWLAAEATGPRERTALRTVDGALDLLARDAALVLPVLAFLALALAVVRGLAHALMAASIGQRLAGIRLAGRDGRPPGPRRCAARAALSLLSAALLGMGVLLALFTRSGRALHDLLAGTTVVEDR